MTELSEKGKTNHKWTSSDAYKAAYDAIFDKSTGKIKMYRRKWVYIRVVNDYFEERNPLWKTSKAAFDEFYNTKENE